MLYTLLWNTQKQSKTTLWNFSSKLTLFWNHMQESYDKFRQCVERQRHYSANKGPYNQGYGLPSDHIWLWEWTVKKEEHQWMDAFKLWCWRRSLKVPWTSRRSNQSNLREITPEFLWEGLMLKLKFQYFSHLMRTDDSLEKSRILGMIKGRRRREC